MMERYRCLVGRWLPLAATALVMWADAATIGDSILNSAALRS